VGVVAKLLFVALLFRSILVAVLLLVLELVLLAKDSENEPLDDEVEVEVVLPPLPPPAFELISLSSLALLGLRPRRDASRDMPTAKHFFKRQN
jgi:hypothetical protein